jgi:hypothetical protein
MTDTAADTRTGHQRPGHQRAQSRAAASSHANPPARPCLVGTIGCAGDMSRDASLRPPLRRQTRGPRRRRTSGYALRSSLRSSLRELISDRVWRSQAQPELATVKWVAWSNHDRLHSSLATSHRSNSSTTTPPRSRWIRRSRHGRGDFPEARKRADNVASRDGRRRFRRSGPGRFLQRARRSKRGPLRPRQQPVNRPSTACGLSDLRLRNMLADRTFQLPTKRRPIPRNSVSVKAGPPQWVHFSSPRWSTFNPAQVVHFSSGLDSL